MKFQIQDRINVPGSDQQKQGVILSALTGVGHQTLYVVTWLDERGVQFTQTFGAHNVDEANPPPRDYPAEIARLRDTVAAQNGVLIARDRAITRIRAARSRKPSSPSPSRRMAKSGRNTSRKQPKSKSRKRK